MCFMGNNYNNLSKLITSAKYDKIFITKYPNDKVFLPKIVEFKYTFKIQNLHMHIIKTLSNLNQST